MPEKIKKLFFAYSETVKEDSPSYHHLAKLIAEDEEFLLKLKPYYVDPSFVALYFTSVIKHLYLFEHDLRQYFQNFTDHPKEMNHKTLDLLKDFHEKNEHVILFDVRNGDLKKNIVERSSVLIPIFHHIVEMSGKQNFNVIELGSKAGLLLNYDRYGYTFNKKYELGNIEDFNIKVKLDGYGKEDLLKPLKHPSFKIGITRNKYDLTDEEDYLWMRSLYYPEETKRRKHFNKARKVFMEHPVEVVEGDELEILDETLRLLPDNEPIIIFHVHLTKHWSTEKKQQLMEIIQKYAANKEIYHVHHQIFNSDIYLDMFEDSMLKREKLAHFDLNALTIDWLYNQKVKI